MNDLYFRQSIHLATLALLANERAVKPGFIAWVDGYGLYSAAPAGAFGIADGLHIIDGRDDVQWADESIVIHPSLQVEIDRAIAAENEIKLAIDGYLVPTDLDGYATTVELQNEINRSVAIDNEIKFALDGYATTLELQGETNRAIAIEQEIKLSLDGYTVGPNSATDTAVALFDSTSGKLIKNSLVTIDSSGNIVTPGLVDGYDLAAKFSIIDAENLKTSELIVPTGFPIPGGDNQTTLSKVDGTLTFTIAPTGSSFDVWVKGIKYTKTTAQTVNWTDVEGIHFFYFNDAGILSVAAPGANLGAIIAGEGAAVAYIYWNAADNVSIVFAEERHSIQMDGYTHLYLHSTQGTAYASGGLLGGFVVDGSGNNNTSAQFSVENTVIWDEDIKLLSSTSGQVLTLPAQIPIFWLSGAQGDWRKKTADTYPIIYSGTAGYTGASGLPAYNEWTGTVWQLSEVTNNQFVLVHYYSCNSLDFPIIGIQGQAKYTTITNARAGADIEMLGLQGTIKLLAKEAVALGSVIFQVSTGYTNVPKARVRTTDLGANYVDWRTAVVGGASSGVTDHGNLTGLLDNDHPQYALKIELDGYVTDLELQNEINRAVAVENEIKIALDGYATTLELQGESERAVAVEQEIKLVLDGYLLPADLDGYATTVELQGEIDRAVAVENEIKISLDGYATTGALQGEVDRAIAVEQEIILALDGYVVPSDLDGYTTTIALQGEIDRAIAVEQEIKLTLDGYLLPADLYGYATTLELQGEIDRAVAVENEIKVVLDGYLLPINLDGYATTVELQGEIDRAVAVEQEIKLALDGYLVPADLDGYATTVELQGEIDRAIAVENEIKLALDGYGGTVIDLDGYATTLELQAETDRAITVENEIRIALDGYNSAGIYGEATLVDGYVLVSLPGGIPEGSAILFSRKTPIDDIGDISLASKTNTEFSLVSSSRYDQSIISWGINSLVAGTLVIGNTTGTAADGGLFNAEINEIKTALDGYGSSAPPAGTCGEATLIDGYVLVTLPQGIPANAVIVWSRKTPLGTIGDITLSSQTTEEFSLRSSSRYDRSVISWTINSVITGTLVLGSTTGTAGDGGLLQGVLDGLGTCGEILLVDGYALVSLPGAIPVDANILFSRKTTSEDIGDISILYQNTNEFVLVSSSNFDQSLVSWAINGVKTNNRLVIGNSTGTAADGGLLQGIINTLGSCGEATLVDGYVLVTLTGTIPLDTVILWSRKTPSENIGEIYLASQGASEFSFRSSSSYDQSVISWSLHNIITKQFVIGNTAGTAADGGALTAEISRAIAVETAEINRAISVENEIKSVLDGYSLLPDVQVFDTPGDYTWTKPAGCTIVEVLLVGGGGGGSGGRVAYVCGGGGGGSGFQETYNFIASELPDIVSVTVGAGGAGSSGGDGYNGNDGYASIFGLAYAYGGGAGRTTGWGGKGHAGGGGSSASAEGGLGKVGHSGMWQTGTNSTGGTGGTSRRRSISSNVYAAATAEFMYGGSKYQHSITGAAGGGYGVGGAAGNPYGVGATAARGYGCGGGGGGEYYAAHAAGGGSGGGDGYFVGMDDSGPIGNPGQTAFGTQPGNGGAGLGGYVRIISR